jgi:hypothetical protein
MTLSTETLDHLRACDLTSLARESEGRFPLAELEEASRSGEGAADLVAWLEYQRGLFLAGSSRATRDDRSHGSRSDAPPIRDAKNYEQGPESEVAR